MSTEIAPETADGWTVLHQFYHVDWSGLQRISAEERNEIAVEFGSLLAEREKFQETGQSTAYHVIGHKGDLLLLHYFQTFDQCAELELTLEQMRASRFMRPSTSYVSVVELGMYHATISTREELQQEGLKPESPEWREELAKRMASEKAELQERLFGAIPDRRFLCFYPMSKKREEAQNWYRLSLQDRGFLMMEHGMIGRKYAGRVNQVISGSIGFDDWEWGVDLHVDDPLVVKQLVYELRFDEGSSLYADFGPFYFARRFAASNFDRYFTGTLPDFSAPDFSAPDSSAT